ncbi:uncharacterized protein Z520_07143 [Fonsecaea multimorphosa CBS 102226]|uniref:Flavodoxin-like domain-containing protein n=1 Tax=Fonsecaea multimorphosa CBS 102226 TaxID=1442371 RepID=A0A0D2K1Y7_9EURO|nr:uncharacterized protein Z520_07143 [Fonsecaea multimorphosa CBS 102226]KIX97029.1 hypothetical protein Z520_07143 [Fonsecaea multimorphosa CBS 102226]OAL22808.1 hypothetical protein AYO22_06716 [Fonsecaea multimorphosa]
MPFPKPYKLITISTDPERASRMVRKIAEDVKDRYIIIHCVNAARIDEVESLVSLYRPDILVCASMWSSDQSAEIKRIARTAVPGLRCYVVPQGMQAERGSEATTEHVKNQLPKIIDGDLGLK